MPTSEEQQDNLTIQDYLDASGESSSRARNLTLALVVACVLTFIALLNSLQDSWMVKRLERLREPASGYLIHYVGSPPQKFEYERIAREKYVEDFARYQLAKSADKGSEAEKNQAPDAVAYLQRADEEFERDNEMYKARYQAFLQNVSRALVDTRYLVRVPFFGITFDINDLGMLAGIGLTTLLGLLRLALSGELDNLKLSFRHAKNMGKLAEFYRLLAMKQVLTTPPLPDRKITWFHIYVPKLLYFLPLLVYAGVVLNDLYTNQVGFALDNLRTVFLLAVDLVFLFIIITLSVAAYQRTRDIDEKWAESWCDYMAEEFKDTHDGEWLRRLNRAVEAGDFSPEQLVASLPSADEKDGKRHLYKSKDNWLLIIDLNASSSSIKPAEGAKAQTA